MTFIPPYELIDTNEAKSVYDSLTPLEAKVLLAIGENIQSNTSGEFGFADEVYEDQQLERFMTKKQFVGVCSSLTKKDFYDTDEEFQQTQMSAMGAAVWYAMTGNSFEDVWFQVYTRCS